MSPGEPREAPGRQAGAERTAPARARMMEEVLDGLTSPQKTISPKYFYDEAGSRLFDRITELDEYYLTRAETAILRQRGGEMAAEVGPAALVVEPGSGSSAKTRILLRALERPAGYVPVDISGDYLMGVAEGLRREFPELPVIPVVADFTRRFDVPEPRRPAARRVVFFPGSTIGNFTRFQAQRLLERMARVARPDGAVLVGVDLVKSRSVLEAAYDDARGVTARFNLNVLARLNRELGADFDLDAFEHRAVWDPEEARIEMRLVSRRPQSVRMGGRTLAFQRGEHILTEYSHKYTLDSFARLAGGAGLRRRRVWTDGAGRFSIQLLEPGST